MAHVTAILLAAARIAFADTKPAHVFVDVDVVVVVFIFALSQGHIAGDVCMHA